MNAKTLQGVIKKKNPNTTKPNQTTSGSESNHHSFKIQTLCQGMGGGQHTAGVRQAQGNSWCSNLPLKIPN